MRILIVDRSPQVIERLTELVNTVDGEVVATAFTEDEGLAALDRHEIDAAIIELQLAQGTGFGVIRKMRARRQPAGVIVFTNHAVPALKVAAFEAGADFFLDKAKDLAHVARVLGDLREDIRHG